MVIMVRRLRQQGKWKKPGVSKRWDVTLRRTLKLGSEHQVLLEPRETVSRACEGTPESTWAPQTRIQAAGLTKSAPFALSLIITSTGIRCGPRGSCPKRMLKPTAPSCRRRPFTTGRVHLQPQLTLRQKPKGFAFKFIMHYGGEHL